MPKKILFAKKRKTWILLSIIIVVNLIAKANILSKLPPNSITFWLDGYYHLGISKMIINTGNLPDSDPCWLNTGVPHVYPDGYSSILALVQMIGGVSSSVASNLMMVAGSTLGLIAIFLISRKVFENELIAFFTSLILLFMPGYFESTSLPIPNTTAMFLIPLIFYMLIRNYENPKKSDILLSGILSAGLVIMHPMSFEVFFVVVVLTVHLILFFGKNFRKKATSWLAVLIIAFLISSLWWVRLYQMGLEHLSVREKDELQLFEHYLWYLSVVMFVAPLGLMLGIFRKKEFVLLLISWIIVSWVLVENYRLDIEVYSKYLPQSLSFIKEFLKPNWGQRFFVYISQPLALSAGFLFAEIYSFVKKRKNHRIAAIAIFITFIAIFGCLIYSVYVNPPWFMRLINDTWVSRTELEALNEMSNVMSKDSMIDADFPFDEVYFGMTGKAVSICPQLRASIPLVDYLDDYVGIYFSNNTEEIKSLAKKYGITHVILSDRIKTSGHFAITSSGRWPYTYSGGVNNADLSKFYNETVFKKIFTYKDVEVFCIRPC